MDELTKKLPMLLREETLPEIPKKIRWKSRFFGKVQLLEYIRNYYEEESLSRIPFYIPYIYMKEIFCFLCRHAHVPKKSVSMVLIDGGDSRTDYFLYEFLEQLNYLTIITDRPEYFESLQERAFQELGLLIDLVLPWENKRISGNVLWDFSLNLQTPDCYPKDCVCFVGHKPEWKIKDLLKECPAITAVSVGKIMANGFSLLPSMAECLLVRADFPFRKGHCEEVKRWCRQKGWSVKMRVKTLKNLDI